MRYFLFHNFRAIFALDRWIKQRFTKIGLLLLASSIAAGVFGIDTRQNLAYQLFSILLALLLLGIFSSWFFRVRLTARRDLPRLATVGESLHYQVQVQNHTQKQQQSLILRENIKLHPPSFESFLRTKEPGQEKRNWFDNYVGYPRWLWLMNISKGAEIAEQSLPAISPNSSVSIKMTLTPLRRGYVDFTSMTFARSDPLGLFNAGCTIDMPTPLLVLPKRYPVNEISLSIARKFQMGGVPLALGTGEQADFDHLREYRPGDSLRHIHWKSWAKVGKPIVKAFQDEFFVRHALIFDTFSEEAGGEVFEAAVSVAASFAAAPRNHEVLLDLMFVGTQAYNFTSGRGLAQSEQLLEILACVETCTDKPFQDLYNLVMEHTAALSACVCILLNWDEPRQKLLHSLTEKGVSFLGIVVSLMEIDTEKFPSVHILHPDAIAEGLAKF
ncbi:hypothetical protein PN36_06350 [Candidatus Thiomargarita nelsonii]|uniref:DUF58 domain-containing protein n=1 Tax=Candidatus Thiomargarita nelsonii TaxID=1003181 RepID=A0A0A6P6C1_9GAMM|nr:hypothetical protein PN36_06350 [Candidatus Thiomargarita nelsonii]